MLKALNTHNVVYHSNQQEIIRLSLTLATLLSAKNCQIKFGSKFGCSILRMNGFGNNGHALSFFAGLAGNLLSILNIEPFKGFH